jgi:hypothetical protein
MLRRVRTHGIAGLLELFGSCLRILAVSDHSDHEGETRLTLQFG